MSNALISDADVERALDFLRDNADEAANAKADLVQLEESRKSLKALIMREHSDMPLAAQEREAYADDRYTNHIRGLAEATRRYERLRLLRGAAEAKIEAWRTFNANMRSMKI